MRTLRENQRVSYDLQEDRPGKKSATNLQSAEDGQAPAAKAEDAARSRTIPATTPEQVDMTASAPRRRSGRRT